MHSLTKYYALLACLFVTLLIVPNHPAFSQATPNAACALSSGIDQDYCRFFVQFTDLKSPADKRVLTALGRPAGSNFRSIALIIAVAKYPGQSLEAVNVDAKNLVEFFKDNQKFDEVILLKDDDATKSTITYFLHTLLPARGYAFGGNVRLAVTYSGHGTNNGSTDRSDAAFILSSARNDLDPDGTISMKQFGEDIEKNASRYFHVLTLINACYGGNIYGASNSGGYAGNYRERGSIAITAGSDRTSSFSIDDKLGSFFFSTLIQGVETGYADRDFNAEINRSGQTIGWGGLTQIPQLVDYMAARVAEVNRQNIPFNGKVLKVDNPWVGPIEPPGVTAVGGFFFLSPVHRVGESNIPFPATPGSSIPGHPEIKTFSPPFLYPIQGYNINSTTGYIDWNKFSSLYRPRFIYVRSSGWAEDMVDSGFQGYWQALTSINRDPSMHHVDRGAYHRFNFCEPVSRQLSVITKQVLANTNDLPFGIQITLPDQRSDPHQFSCLTSISAARNAILTLADTLAAIYHKTPIIMGNRSSLAAILNPRFDKFMLWLESYSGSGAAVSNRLALPGDNPWTLWTYASDINVRGIGQYNSAEVFFGDERLYSAFKAGASNVAVMASAKH